ncbi:heavy-metal-associated domain-containing protein [Geomesophilobacter sediminis]|uniref:Heavy-metal-associated domain-containing protein n=1 Tax=Geomesophilobacter sediminis TaxID=2798584 RepID=A0A8J7M217_9BACT|nr:heavy-metal-associated domain-containing protein [Geomesophilobacter sediminis]MBJ6727260.1 heavy-metal-associated domain-containing protein [Geomesophilobacter sediminis]
MKKYLLNSLLLSAVVGLLIFCAGYLRIGSGADAVVVLTTSGMSCGSCAGRVEAALREERGVVATEVDLEAGRVTAGIDSKKVSPERIAIVASAAGFASTVRSVLSPAQFMARSGHEVGASGTGGRGCCGNQTTNPKRGDS